ncbi:MAG: ribosome biogenesis GTP-binding protein YihA/YsxC [Cytophagales bacterium]|nr:ribosome biogenesis GTP-binding protein YihA/YsxC [Cytophagales bacterium]
MKIKTSEFVVSNTDYKKCPKPDLPELAFIGRSNVGKSSLINMLMQRKSLAKVSGRPGKTQLINHFLINKEWYLVDLPGYGFAKVSKKLKSKWGSMTQDYLTNRPNLACLCVLIDSRLEPQKIDLEFIDWLGEKGLPFMLIFTKADKQSPNKTASNVARFRKVLKKNWDELPPHFVTSSLNTAGRDDVINFIEEIIDSAKA